MYKPSMNIRGLTQSEYARHRGITRQAVFIAKKDGRLVIGADGLIDVKASDAKWAAATPGLEGGVVRTKKTARARAVPTPPATPAEVASPEVEKPEAPPAPAPQDTPAVPPPLAPASTPTLVDAKTRREMAMAEKAELDLRSRRGELLEVEVVRKAVFDIMRSVRERLFAIPTRLAPELAGANTPAKVRVLLEGALEEALADLQRLEKLAPEPADGAA